MTAPKTKPFLSRLTKSGQQFVNRVAVEDRDLSFTDLLKKRWTASIPDEHDEYLPKSRQTLKDCFPKLTDQQIDSMLWLHRFGNHFDDVAVGRRALLDDPAELVQGLRIHYRVAFALRGRWDQQCDVDQLLPMCASGDLDFARRVAKGRRGACHALLSPTEQISVATVSWLNQDDETLAILVDEIDATSMKYVQPWDQATLLAFCAAVRGEAAEVAVQMGLLLESVRRLRDKTDIDRVVNLNAHGLYRLFESTSPKLVQAFDAAQGFPWDPEMHAWCQEHPVSDHSHDIAEISKLLHDIVVNGNVPRWLPRPATMFQVELTEGDPDNAELLDIIDCHLSYSEHRPKPLVEACPVVLLHEYPQEYAESFCQDLNDAGATARAQETSGMPYRPIGSDAH